MAEDSGRASIFTRNNDSGNRWHAAARVRQEEEGFHVHGGIWRVIFYLAGCLHLWLLARTLLSSLQSTYSQANTHSLTHSRAYTQPFHLYTSRPLMRSSSSSSPYLGHIRSRPLLVLAHVFLVVVVVFQAQKEDDVEAACRFASLSP